VKAAVVAALAALAAAPAAGAASGGPTVRASLAPSSVGVGDPFTLTIDATARGGGDLRILADSGPFVELGSPHLSRSGGRVRLVETLACVDRSCAPGAKPRRVVLPPPRASLGSAAAVGPALVVTVVPHVPQSSVAAAAARYREQTQVARSAAPFGLVAGAAIALAAVLAGAGLALAVLALRRPSRAATSGIGRAVDLELALRLLRESAARPVPDRRRAADLVAVAAAGEVGDEPATAATRVAWAPPPPGPADVESLARSVESAAGGLR